MTLFSEDEKVIVNVGSYDIWNCFYSTVIVRLDNIKKDISLALAFLETGNCEPENCMETARELNLIRDNLSLLSTKELVYDHKKPKKKAPWADNISPIVTSCGNLFTTADGKDLIFELTALLSYCSIKKVAAICQ